MLNAEIIRHCTVYRLRSNNNLAVKLRKTMTPLFLNLICENRNKLLAKYSKTTLHTDVCRWNAQHTS